MVMLDIFECSPPSFDVLWDNRNGLFNHSDFKRDVFIEELRFGSFLNVVPFDKFGFDIQLPRDEGAKHNLIYTIVNQTS